MTLYSTTIETDEFDDLCHKVMALSNLNWDIFQAIQERNIAGEKVILKHTHHIECDITEEENGAVEVRENPWSLKKKSNTADVTELINKWRYSGESLENEIIFGKFNTNLHTFSDVARLIVLLKDLAMKYLDFVIDRPQTREGLRNLLSNMERLQVALGELHGMTLDAIDTVDAECYEITSSSYDELVTQIPSESLSFEGDQEKAEAELSTPKQKNKRKKKKKKKTKIIDDDESMFVNYISADGSSFSQTTFPGDDNYKNDIPACHFVGFVLAVALCGNDEEFE